MFHEIISSRPGLGGRVPAWTHLVLADARDGDASFHRYASLLPSFCSLSSSADPLGSRDPWQALWESDSSEGQAQRGKPPKNGAPSRGIEDVSAAVAVVTGPAATITDCMTD